MYRVAKKGVLVIEGNDSLIMRLACKIKFSEEFEVSSVKKDKEKGGILDTGIPNYVYRWTEREIEKTIQSYDPICKHTYLYDYATAYPCTPQLELKNGLKVLVLSLLKPFYIIFSRVFYKQQNQFAFFVKKASNESELFPWLYSDRETNCIKFNKEWANKKYRL